MSFLTALTAVTGVLDTVSTYKQSQAQNEQAASDMAASYQAGSLDLSQLQERLRQTVQSNDVEVFDRERQGLKDRSKILLAAGEANLSGNNVMRLLASNMFDESRDKGIRKTNLENTLNQGRMEARKAAADASTNAAYASSKRTNPFLNTLAVGAKGALETYGRYEVDKLD